MIDSDPLENLLPSLLQCFSVIFMGYLAVRLSLITSQASAIGTYVTKFALPALFFRSMATIDFVDVNWLFIVAVSLGKVIFFVLTIICTMVITRPINLGMAGILSMFITQSNDVALGYPILLSLYPDLAKYIYLFAPAQLIFINPLCFILLEWHEYRTSLSLDIVYVSPKVRVLLVLKNVLLNPLVFMTIIGVVFNLILNHKLPLVLDKILQILADSFAGVALFYLGMNMVGKLSKVTKAGVYTLVFLLLGKLIFLPFLTRELVVHLVNLQDPSNKSLNYSLVAFLYGGLPTAPPVFLIANSFQMLPDLIATGLVLGTFLSGPLMFINARVITMVVASKSQFDSILKSTAVSVSVISLLGCIWVLLLFMLNRRYRSLVHRITMCYTFYVILTCSGVVIGRIFLASDANDKNKTADWSHYFQFAIFYIGCVGSRLWVSIIAASLMIVKRKGISNLRNYITYLYLIGFCLPIAITALLLITTKRQSVVDIDPSFQYGKSQIIASLIVLIFSITFTVVVLIIRARPRTSSEARCSDAPKQKLLNEDSENESNDNSTNIEENGIIRRISLSNNSGPSGTSLPNGSRSQTEMGLLDLDATDDDDEFHIHRHLALTIILVVTMGFGLFLCLWRLIKEELSGVYIELEFLDCVFNFGQGFILWAIFGLDMELIVIPFKNKIMKLWNNIQEFYIPLEGNLSADVLRIKKQFLKYHLEKCRADIVKDMRHMFHLHCDVFSGKSLIDWILRIGLANTRDDGIAYGQALLISRIIEHIKKNRNLLDDEDSLYRFVDMTNTDYMDLDIEQSTNNDDLEHDTLR